MALKGADRNRTNTRLRTEDRIDWAINSSIYIGKGAFQPATINSSLSCDFTVA